MNPIQSSSEFLQTQTTNDTKPEKKSIDVSQQLDNVASIANAKRGSVEFDRSASKSPFAHLCMRENFKVRHASKITEDSKETHQDLPKAAQKWIKGNAMPLLFRDLSASLAKKQ
jgi:hypothetical protein